MILPWDGASKVVFSTPADKAYTGALFSDRVCVYDTDSKYLLTYVMGSYVDLAFNGYYLMLIDDNGYDSRISIDNNHGLTTPHDHNSFATGLNLYIHDIYSCTGGNRHGIAFTYSARSAPDGIRNSIFSEHVYYWLEYPEYTPYTYHQTTMLHDEKSYFKRDTIFNVGGLAASYSYPQTISLEHGGTAPVAALKSYNILRQWGPSYIHTVDSLNFGVSYWDGSTLNTTSFPLANRKAAMVDNEHVLITYTTTYKLYKYNSTSKLFEEVTAFNPGGAALPTAHTHVIINIDADVAIAIDNTKFHTIDLSDGSYITVDHMDTSRSIGHVCKNIYDPGVGKDKLYYYIKYPYDSVRVFNITQQTQYSKDVTAFFNPYIDDINALLTGGDSVSGDVGANGVEVFSGGICLFSYAGTYYGGAFGAGAGRFSVDATTGDLSLIDTDMDFLAPANSTFFAAKKTAFDVLSGPSKFVNDNSVRISYNYETTPPYTSGGTGEAVDSEFIVALADPNDFNKVVIITQISEYDDVYTLSNFSEGDCLVNPDSIIDVIAIEEYIITAVIKDSKTWLLAFSTEFKWVDNSKQATGGILDEDIIEYITGGESFTLEDYYLPYAARLSEPIASLSKNADDGVVVNYSSGKSLFFSIGELLE